MEATITLDGRQHHVRIEEVDGIWQAHVDGASFRLKVDRRGSQAAVDAGGSVHVIDLADPHTAIIDGSHVGFRIDSLKGVAGATEARTGGHGPIKPPMTGRLERILVKEGDAVSRGDVLFVLEAMKMRNEVKSPADGIIGKVMATAGDAVDPSLPVLELLES